METIRIDLSGVNEVTKGLDEGVNKINEIVSKIDSELASVANAWQGADAARFIAALQNDYADDRCGIYP